MGATGTLAEFAGNAVVVFFGLTQRPDVCPTSLSRDIELCKLLGADGDKTQEVFVTVEPKRDMSAVLRRYIKAFDPNFAALRGDARSYTLDHAAASYAFVPRSAAASAATGAVDRGRCVQPESPAAWLTPAGRSDDPLAAIDQSSWASVAAPARHGLGVA